MRSQAIKITMLCSTLMSFSLCSNLNAQVDKQLVGPMQKALMIKPGVSEPSSEDKSMPQYVPGEVLVKFREGVDPQAVLNEADISSLGIERVHTIAPVAANFKKQYKIEKDSDGWYWFMGKQYKESAQIPDQEAFNMAYEKMSPERQALYRNYKIDLPENISVEEAVSRLKSNPDVEYAYPNYIREAYAIPSDPKYSEQWALPKINASAAWDVNTGSSNVIVAVIDTGVDYNHEDLSANVWINTDEIPNNGADDDNNGYIDDYRGYDFVSVPYSYVALGEDFGPRDNNPMDVHGHGTHCAGIVAAVRNNAKGISGIAPGCKVMAVRAGYKTPSGKGSLRDSDIEKAVLYAIDNGAKVISMSFGGFSEGAYIDELKTAYSEDIILIAAAGNASTSDKHYPSAMNEVLAVAATDQNDSMASFSDYGNWVDVAAPGTAILSTLPGNQYAAWSGTSMACPYAAGLAALVKSKNPAFTNEQVYSVLKIGADSISTNYYTGQGRINAYKSLQINTPPPVAKLNTDGSVRGIIGVEGTAYAVLATGASCAGGTMANNYYSLEYGKGETPSSWTHLSGSYPYCPATIINGIIHSGFDTRKLDEGPFVLRLRIKGGDGKIVETRSLVRINNQPIVSPLPNDILNNVIVIKGSYWADSPSYSIKYGKGLSPVSWSDQGITLKYGANGVLGEWNTVSLANDFYAVKLTVNYPFGQKEYLVKNIYIDKRLKPGWPVYLSQKGVSWTNDIQKVTVADLDNDGLSELVTVDAGSVQIGLPEEDRYSQLLVYRHDGTLWWSQRLMTGYYTCESYPVVGDIDGDGFKEIIVGAYSSQLYAYNHDGSQAAGYWPYYDDRTYISSIVLADLNNDQKDEIIIRSRWGFYVDGIYTEDHLRHLLLVLDSQGNVISEILLPYYDYRYWYQHPATGNFDADPELEIATISGQSQITVYNLDGTKVAGWPVSANADFTSSVAIGDVNKDGKEEVVVTAEKTETKSGGIFVYGQDGNLLPGWPQVTDKNNLSSSALADMDGDGDLEICVSSGNQVYLYHHNGVLVGGWPQQTLSYPVDRICVSPTIADINNDSKLDVLVLSNGINREAAWQLEKMGGIWAWNANGTRIDLNPSDKAYSIFVEYGDFAATDGDPVTVCDLDNNGKLDLISTSVRDTVFGDKPYDVKDRNSIYAWELNVPNSANKKGWPAFQHDSQHTGLYNHYPRVVSLSSESGIFYADSLYTFTTVHSDMDGAGDIKSANLIINTGPVTGAFYAHYRSDNNMLYLYNGNSLVGGYAPGGGINNVIDTPYGKLYPVGTTVTKSGNKLTINWSISLKSSLAGSKNIYLSTTDMAGASSGWQQKANITVNAATTTTSVAPVSGNFQTYTPYNFTAVYSDPGGFNKFKSASLLIGAGASSSEALYAYYRRDLNKLYLFNNSTLVGGFAPGSADIIETPYGKLYCGQTTVTASGNNLTIKWNISFNSVLRRDKNIYLDVMYTNDVSSGWHKKGRIGINGTPKIISFTPNSGKFSTDTVYTFTGSFSDIDGNSDINDIYFGIDTDENYAGGFWVRYQRTQNKLFLFNGNASVGGYAPGSNYVIDAPYGKLYCSQTTVTASGNNLTLALKVSFKNVSKGLKNLYVRVYDPYNVAGSTYVKYITVNCLPSVVSLSPNSGTFNSNAAYNFTAVYADDDGYAHIKSANFIVNTSAATGAFFAHYRRDQNKLYLYNGSTPIGGYAPGSNNVIDTAYGKLYCAQTAVSGSGSNLTVKWAVSFKSALAGSKRAYLAATDSAGASCAWQQKGTITVR